MKPFKSLIASLVLTCSCSCGLIEGDHKYELWLIFSERYYHELYWDNKVGIFTFDGRTGMAYQGGNATQYEDSILNILDNESYLTESSCERIVKTYFDIKGDCKVKRVQSIQYSSNEGFRRFKKESYSRYLNFYKNTDAQSEPFFLEDVVE